MMTYTRGPGQDLVLIDSLGQGLRLAAGIMVLRESG